MSLVVDKATLTTLIAERAALFEHDIHKQWLVVFWLCVVCLVIMVTGIMDHRKNRGGETRITTMPVCIFIAVCMWVVLRVDTYFEQKQFERAPQTYVIKHLR